MTETQAMTALSALADKLAMELVFAEAGSDNGLLPVNSFLTQMEETPSLPAALKESLAPGRALIDQIFLTTGQFTPESIQNLGAWAQWLQSAITATKKNSPLPPLVLPVPNEEAEANSPRPSPVSETEPELSLLINLKDDRDLLKEFVNESREHLQNIETGVLVLEDSPEDSETLNSIFRAFHTFKGGSGFLNLIPINKLAHELESLLDLARQHRIAITHEVIDIILSGGDTLKQFIDAISLQLSEQTPHGPIVIPIEHLLNRVAFLIAGIPVNNPASAYDGNTEFIRRALESGKSLESLQLPPKHAPPISTQPSVPVTQSSLPPKPGAPASAIKVDVQKLDSLVDMVGEMVIAQSLVAQDSELRNISNTRLAHNLAQLNRVTKELQRVAMSLRMVPIRGTFQKMNRLVRDLSARADKQIDLVIAGEDTELDRNIVEELGDPLIHMIRNSVDHGIETPEARQAVGKSSVGKITLSAFHQGGNFVVQIQDDGAGLNRERILKKAIDQRLVDEAEDLTDQEVFAFIFSPGFSTAEVITDISGRGVGMDVVRRNIEKLRGRIEIESTLGKGATFSIYLPLTLAIIDGLIVRIAKERYIIPTLSVRESFRPLPHMLSTVRGRGELVCLRGKHLPLLRLEETFSDAAEKSDPTESVVIVVEVDRVQHCILVDELVGRQEVVIKSLGQTFQFNPWLAGAAILGDGRVGLILDVNTLVNQRPSLANAA
jgi:two-component system chemotaxis sensor kinase CheA